MTFETIKRSVAAQEAVRQIRELVERGELGPGEKLPPERVLARELGSPARRSGRRFGRSSS